MKTNEIIQQLTEHKLDKQLQLCTCHDDVSSEIERYVQLLNCAYKEFGDQDFHLISAPGRTEVSGNHTDHQLGRVLAASVNMDTACAVYKTQDYIVEFISEGYKIDSIDLSNLEIQESEKNKSESLIRGIAAYFKQKGYKIGGFKAYANSTVLNGSGISSSACFETLIGTIFSNLYNDGTISPIEIAKIGQLAENNYFGKPCGLMDQMACSVGGFVFIDFKKLNNPIVEQINFDFSHSGYSLCLVDTKGDHADLSEEYGLMPSEMKQVASKMGKTVLSECTLSDFLNEFNNIQTLNNDRALLRAIHFFNETDRVLDIVTALKENDIDKFNQKIIESGYSSYMYLQNVYGTTHVESQRLSIALAVTEQILRNKGSYRVHGGGLAGTIQAFVPNDCLETYKTMMEKIYGAGACFVLSIRPVGGFKII